MQQHPRAGRALGAAVDAALLACPRGRKHVVDVAMLPPPCCRQRRAGLPAPGYAAFLLLLVLLAVQGGAAAARSARPCVPRDYGEDSVVCVCNATYCDDLPRIQPSGGIGRALLFTSSRAGLRFRETELVFTAERPADGTDGQAVAPTFEVDSNRRFQAIHGWGATVTDSAGINIKALSEAARDNLIRSYFSEDGIEYNLLRVPIGGTDCSTRKYTLHDTPGDATLANFSLATEDFQYKLPVLRWARDAGPKDRPLRLLASAWTAPPWMKTNNDYTGFGFLRGEHYQTWADYHLKFLDAYAAQGFRFWALTTGNEPMNGVVGPFIRFNSMGWTPFQMRVWVGNYLGPTLRDNTASKHAAVHLLTLDDQRINLPWWINIVMAHPNASKHIDGFAVHWYTNYFTPVLGMDLTHSSYPDKFILATEASSGFNNWDLIKVILGSWKRAEDYFIDILDDLNHWATGWMEWSLVLDTSGGPSWSGNFVDTSILVNGTADEFLKQPTYYAIGHFSKFLPPGAKRVRVDPERQGGVRNVAFMRQDGATVVIFYNGNEKEMAVNVYDPFRGYLEVKLEPKSFNTIVYW